MDGYISNWVGMAVILKINFYLKLKALKLSKRKVLHYLLISINTTIECDIPLLMSQRFALRMQQIAFYKSTKFYDQKTLHFKKR